MKRVRKLTAVLVALFFIQVCTLSGMMEMPSDSAQETSEIAQESEIRYEETTASPQETIEPSVEVQTTTFEPEITLSATETPEPEITMEAEVSPEPDATPDPETTPDEAPTPMPDETLEATPEPTMVSGEDQLPCDVPESTPPVMEIQDRDNSIGWKGVVPTDEIGMAIPMLFQFDYRTTVCNYNGEARSVATSGCGAASMSMVIAYLTGDTQQNPYTLFCRAVEDGRYHGNGLSHDTLSWFAEKYGVKSKWVSNDADTIMQALNSGKPVIAHMGEGIFTSLGHYIVLRGVTEDGLILVNDPNSRANCSKAFPIDTLIREARSSSAFMVCWVDNDEDVETINLEETEELIAEPTQAPAAEAPDDIAETLLWGDVNRSGRVDMNDVQVVYDVCLGRWADDAELLDRCDLNGDGRVDTLDIRMLANYVSTGTMPAQASGEQNDVSGEDR